MKRAALAQLNTPTFDKIASILVNEPFCLSIEEIGGLTPFQVQYLYFRPDSMKDNPANRTSMAPTQVDSTLQSMFIQACVHSGKTEAEARKLWDEDTKQREANRVVNEAKLAAERAVQSKAAQAKWDERRRKDFARA